MIWAAAITALAAAVTALAAATNPASTAQRLVDTYSPITMLRTRSTRRADNKAEQYRPTSVHIMLGNPKVRLAHPKTRVTRPAP